MNPPLELRDIHLPDTSLWWPPALGWWLLLALVLSLMIALPWMWRRWRSAQRRQALIALARIESDTELAADDRQLTQALSRWLRQVTMTYFPRAEVARLTGEDWIERLDYLIGQNELNRELVERLAEAEYRPDVQIDAPALLAHCQSWVKLLPRNATPSKTVGGNRAAV